MTTLLKAAPATPASPPTPSWRRRGPFTFADFLERIREGEKADLLDGVIYMASPDNTDSLGLTNWLIHIFGGFLDEKKLGVVYPLRAAYRLADDRAPEPDLGFVSTQRTALIQRGFIDGPPDLAIEIVSPSSVERDYEHKRSIYEQNGVREYWILDPDDQRVLFLRLRDGHYEEMKLDGHIFRSDVLTGFWLDVRWLLNNERPSGTDVIKQLLDSLKS